MDFHSKITISNYSDIRSVYHSNYSNTKFHIRFSSKDGFTTNYWWLYINGPGRKTTIYTILSKLHTD